MSVLVYGIKPASICSASRWFSAAPSVMVSAPINTTHPKYPIMCRVWYCYISDGDAKNLMELKKRLKIVELSKGRQMLLSRSMNSSRHHWECLSLEGTLAHIPLPRKHFCALVRKYLYGFPCWMLQRALFHLQTHDGFINFCCCNCGGFFPAQLCCHFEDWLAQRSLKTRAWLKGSQMRNVVLTDRWQ